MHSIFNLFFSSFLLLQSVCRASLPNLSQPVVIFVPGAWHSPDAFQETIKILHTKGFASRKIYLPSVGRSPPVSSIEPDVQAIRDVALAEMAEGHDVTVVCHSYGGLPTSQALKDLNRPKNPGDGRVLAIVYIAAVLLPEGVTLNAASASHGGNATDLRLELLDDGNLFFRNDSNPAEAFYNDVSPKEAKYWVSKLRPHASKTFETSGNYAAWKDIPSWYLITQQDKAIQPEIQRAFVKEAREYLDHVGGPGTGERMLKSEEIDAGHSPFLSRSQETADFIERASVRYSN